MCRTGGPRCTAHARESLDRALAAAMAVVARVETETDPVKLEQAQAQVGPASRRLATAQAAFDTTSGGLKQLADTLRNNPSDEAALRRWRNGYSTRLQQLQQHDLAAGRPPRPDLAFTIAGEQWCADGSRDPAGPVDKQDRRIAAVIPLDRTETWAVDYLADLAYDWRAPGNPNINGETLALQLGDNATENNPKLSAVAEVDNARFWRIIGHAQNRLTRQMDGRQVEARGDLYTVRHSAGGGVELVPVPSPTGAVRAGDPVSGKAAAASLRPGQHVWAPGGWTLVSAVDPAGPDGRILVRTARGMSVYRQDEQVDVLTGTTGDDADEAGWERNHSSS